MSLKIVDDDIYDQDGNWLKKIECPKSAQLKDMQSLSSTMSKCSLCDHVVHNTDFMSESDIMTLLRRDPKACLKISVSNPIFEVQS
ncbi:hypothetical protein A9199_13705 [Donghicola sp. JL3646]|nr:hypothetical protein BSK21_13420 [Marivivens sp. JLT3646]OBR38657.1 hypothetical protein A9199_13705 [Donghicola sp. JL3646]